ncbi:hypothetical protein A3L11_09285 [Thermococcus siculi]|uniref:Uncharacterized protein n=1 Tax=Thermococcus siculi TaxID=72803 RepID=A0A2Z2MPK9_9EURY|nr:hypothetical protein [Thermococcus siculi]ASJ09788.1 hypothetical protein A3L11_09285 [Thermococcus siculi]
MRRAALILVLLLLTASTASATPYWFKAGIYAKYVSRSVEDDEHPWKGDTISFNATPNEEVTYYCPHVEFTWRVLRVSGDKAQVALLLQGYNCKKRVWKELDEEAARQMLEEYQERYNFTGGNCLTIESETRNVTICEDRYAEQTEQYTVALTIAEGKGHLFNELSVPENFTRSGVIELDLKTGEFYVNGTPVGKNFLWSENPANITGLELMPGLKVEEVEMINSTVMTYYGDFNAPVYMARTNMIAGSSSKGMDVLLYDGSSGLAISFFTPFSPLWKVLGISEAMIQDTAFAKEHEEEIKNGGKMPPFGLVLAETNIDFTKPEELPEEGPSKTAIAAAVGVAAILAVLVLWRWRR